MNAHVSQGGWPVLVLNADFRPLSYYPLSLWSGRTRSRRSSSTASISLSTTTARCAALVRDPAAERGVAEILRQADHASRLHPVQRALRDRFVRQYCSADDDLTFDHIIPRSKGGQTTWENVVAARSPCNLRKGNLTPQQARMFRVSRRSRRRCISCTATAGCSRRTTCTTAGWIIFIGTPSSIRKFERVLLSWDS